MPSGRRRQFLAALWRLHRWVYRATGGRLGGSLLGIPMLLLTTTGRRSGRARTTPLTYLREGRNFVVIASNGGAPNHPAWWLNLRAHREAEVQVGGRRLLVRVREAEGAERDRLWARTVKTYSGYVTYQARTTRRIPVAVLEPIDGRQPSDP